MDTRLFMWVNGLARATPWAHAAMVAYAVWAGLVLLAAMLVGGWLSGRRQDDPPRMFATALLTGVGVVVAVVLNKAVITQLFQRPRPCTTVHHALALVPCTPDNAFPSDHALLAGAFAAGLLLLNRALGTVAAVAAVFVAFGRVYIGMHHPGDVAAGLVIGAVISVAIVLALRGVVTRLAETLSHTALRPVITAHEAPRGRRALDASRSFAPPEPPGPPGVPGAPDAGHHGAPSTPPDARVASGGTPPPRPPSGQ